MIALKEVQKAKTNLFILRCRFIKWRNVVNKLSLDPDENIISPCLSLFRLSYRGTDLPEVLEKLLKSTWKRNRYCFEFRLLLSSVGLCHKFRRELSGFFGLSSHKFRALLTVEIEVSCSQIASESLFCSAPNTLEHNNFMSQCAPKNN